MKSPAAPALLLTLFLLMGASANATSLSLTDCDSQGCAGSDVFLNVVVNGSGWDITLTLDSTGYYGAEDGVVQAGFKAINGISNNDITSFTASDGSWSNPKVAGINGGGGALCDGSDDAAFVCTSGYANIETDGTYTWEFFIEGGTLLDVSSWAIKFQYCDEADENCKGKVLSAHSTGTLGTPVPEPSAALVFAAGLLAAASKLRRRR